MPRYDFKCRVCAGVFEAIVPIDLLVLPCPICPAPEEPSQILADRQLCCPATIHIH